MEERAKGAVATVKSVVTGSLLFGWAITTFVVALSGPFGTFETQTFAWRLVYWGCLIAVAILIALAWRLFWRQILAARPEWVEDVAVILSLGLTFGPLVVEFNSWLTGGLSVTSLSWHMTVGITICVGAGILVLRRWMAPTAPAGSAAPSRDRLLDRIDAPDGVRLTRISSDNHHIRICTDDGAEYRILMRLRDALGEIDVEPGLCTHRSHWVALRWIILVDETGGKPVVRTTCGSSVPVGPKYRGELVNAGLLAA
ncbi:LytTR family DNA-binding domain-containing protein [Pseudooctadecabacter jejudonensis]|uniref:HTH LytTR-type domain-containing protein n=1 Tax=Pseudooctadecabacter jejudonensis TaxID=1391910 RepID=A0A1Y5SX02_9RHOB|nr:LytTR family DNA-binding domain-containing protein [Pseudooctadecabacter jejudonensis]SLN49786.1 hypothetical protein PSJ8397_02584 [Pseudooctadecabacter jejudonensis]